MSTRAVRAVRRSGGMKVFPYSIQIPLRCAHGCRRRGQYILRPCPRWSGSGHNGSGSASSSFLEAGSNLRPARCCWTVLTYGKCVPTTSTRGSTCTTFILPCMYSPEYSWRSPYVPSTRGGTHTYPESHDCCHGMQRAHWLLSGREIPILGC